jgi:hypothetical protein
MPDRACFVDKKEYDGKAVYFLTAFPSTMVFSEDNSPPKELDRGSHEIFPAFSKVISNQ